MNRMFGRPEDQISLRLINQARRFIPFAFGTER
jgi:hypothetical protein